VEAIRLQGNVFRCMDLYWANEDAAYIWSCSTLYPAAIDIEPGSTLEVLAD
jgi:hypothetical protein